MSFQQHPDDLQNTDSVHKESSSPSLARVCQVRLQIQRALLGEIGPNMREILVGWGDDWIHFICIVDGPIQERDEESMSLVESLLYADYSVHHELSHEVVRVDFPKKAPYEEFIHHEKLTCVYQRREY